MDKDFKIICNGVSKDLSEMTDEEYRWFVEHAIGTLAFDLADTKKKLSHLMTAQLLLVAVWLLYVIKFVRW